MIALAALLCGFIFGWGLLISGMMNPTKVLGFLDIFGAWDASLAVVMAGPLAVTSTGFALAKQRGTPLLAPRFQGPTKVRHRPAAGGRCADVRGRPGLGRALPRAGLGKSRLPVAACNHLRHRDGDRHDGRRAVAEARNCGRSGVLIPAHAPPPPAPGMRALIEAKSWPTQDRCDWRTQTWVWVPQGWRIAISKSGQPEASTYGAANTTPQAFDLANG